MISYIGSMYGMYGGFLLNGAIYPTTMGGTTIFSGVLGVPPFKETPIYLWSNSN